MEAVDKKSRVIEYDIIRIITTLLVVIGHINVTGFPAETLGSLGRYIVSHQQPILTWIYTFHMPMFAFLSGMVFCIDHYKNYNDLLVKKFKRVLIPYFTIGLLVLFPVAYIFRIYPREQIFQYINAFCSGQGNYEHLWFLLVLFWCFVVLYFPCKYIVNKCPWGGALLVFFLTRYIVKIEYDAFLFKAAIPYFMPFVLGYIFAHTDMKYFLLKKSKKCFIISITYIIVYAAGYYMMLRFGNGFVFHAQILTYTGIAFVLCGVNVITHMLKSKIDNWSAYIVKISNHTFSIYLLHVPMYFITSKALGWIVSDVELILYLIGSMVVLWIGPTIINIGWRKINNNVKNNAAFTKQITN